MFHLQNGAWTHIRAPILLVCLLMADRALGRALQQPVLGPFGSGRGLRQTALQPKDTTKTCNANNCRKEGQKYCVTTFSATCQYEPNYNCDPCTNFKKLAECYDKGNCQGPTYITNNFGSTKLPHFLAEPTTPSTGIEAIMEGKAQGTEGLWQDAWDAATQNKLDLKEVGVVMNSFAYRQQHQMHAHIGYMHGDFKKCLEQNPYPAKGTWVPRTCTLQGTVSNTFQMYSTITTNLGDVNNLIQQGAATVKGWHRNPSVAGGVIVSHEPANPMGTFAVTLFNSEPTGAGGQDHFNVGDNLLMSY